MFGPFAESIRATTQPCTFLLLAPMTIVVICARARWETLIAAVAAAIVGGWLLVGNWFVPDGWWLYLSAIVGIALLAARLVPPVHRRWSNRGGARLGAGVAGVVTLLGTLWWRPCVGAELGTILPAGQAEPFGQLPAMTAYMLGAVLPLVAIVLLYRTVEPSPDQARRLGLAAFAAGVVIAGSVAIGQHDQVVVSLTRWTTG